MQIGVNQNVEYKGSVYHIQTEDGGAGNPVITTVLLKGGEVLGSKRTPYDDIVGVEDLASAVKELMKVQHKAMLVELKDGLYDLSEEGAEGTEEAPAPEAVEAEAVEGPLEDEEVHEVNVKEEEGKGGGGTLDLLAAALAEAEEAGLGSGVEEPPPHEKEEVDHVVEDGPTFAAGEGRAEDAASGDEEPPSASTPLASSGSSTAPGKATEGGSDISGTMPATSPGTSGGNGVPGVEGGAGGPGGGGGPILPTFEDHEIDSVFDGFLADDVGKDVGIDEKTDNTAAEPEKEVEEEPLDTGVPAMEEEDLNKIILKYLSLG